MLKQTEDNKPKDVYVINQHGRKVGVPYQFYLDHGRSNGLVLAQEDNLIENVAIDDAKKIKPYKIQDLKFSEKKNKVEEVNEVEAVEEEVITIAEKVEESENKLEDSNVFICDICGKVCKNAAGLAAHMRSHDIDNDKKK